MMSERKSCCRAGAGDCARCDGLVGPEWLHVTGRRLR